MRNSTFESMQGKKQKYNENSLLNSLEDLVIWQVEIKTCSASVNILMRSVADSHGKIYIHAGKIAGFKLSFLINLCKSNNNRNESYFFQPKPKSMTLEHLRRRKPQEHDFLSI